MSAPYVKLSASEMGRGSEGDTAMADYYFTIVSLVWSRL